MKLRLLLLFVLLALLSLPALAQEANDSGDSTDVAVSSDAQEQDEAGTGAEAESESTASDSQDKDAAGSDKAVKKEKAEARSKENDSAKGSDATGRIRKGSKSRTLAALQADKKATVNNAEGKAAPKEPSEEEQRQRERLKEARDAAAERDAAGSPPAIGELKEIPEGFIPDSDRADARPPQAEADAAADAGGGVSFTGGDRAAGPDKGAMKGGSKGFSSEEMEKLLPGFAQEQPGKIKEEPGKVVQAPKTPVTVFQTLLGDSMLPDGTSESNIAQEAQDPGAGVDQNFARVLVPHGTITGSTEKKQFHIEGGLQIYYSEVLISADSADIDEHNDVAHLMGKVKIDDPQYTVETDDLLINFKEKKFQATGFVQFKKNAKADTGPNLALDKKDRVRDYFSKQQFELYCKTLYYNWESKEMTALESVRLVHPAFNGTLERLDYNDKTKQYEMSGSVVLEITNYDWIFVNKLVEGDDEKKARALTEGATKINCDRMVYSEESGVAEFYASAGKTVDFVQPSRSIKAVYIEVNDKTKDFYAEGNETQKAVYQQQDGQWLIQGGLISEESTSEDLKQALLKPLTAEAGSITYNFDRKRMELRDGVKINNDTQSVEAGEVIQDETAKFFLMRQNVVVKPAADGYIYAAQIYMDTANDVFTFVGLVDGKLHSDDIPDLTAKAPESPEAGAGAPAQGQRSGPAQGLFQNTGGVTFTAGNRQTSEAEAKDEKAKEKKKLKDGTPDERDTLEKAAKKEKPANAADNDPAAADNDPAAGDKGAADDEDDEDAEDDDSANVAESKQK